MSCVVIKRILIKNTPLVIKIVIVIVNRDRRPLSRLCECLHHITFMNYCLHTQNQNKEKKHQRNNILNTNEIKTFVNFLCDEQTSTLGVQFVRDKQEKRKPISISYFCAVPSTTTTFYCFYL